MQTSRISAALVVADFQGMADTHVLAIRNGLAGCGLQLISLLHHLVVQVFEALVAKLLRYADGRRAATAAFRVRHGRTARNDPLLYHPQDAFHVHASQFADGVGV
jgi:hypothetical protein